MISWTSPNRPIGPPSFQLRNPEARVHLHLPRDVTLLLLSSTGLEHDVILCRPQGQGDEYSALAPVRLII